MCANDDGADRAHARDPLASVLELTPTPPPPQGLSWPVLIPVHDALRDAYWGTAFVLPCLGGTPGGGSARLSADSVHISGLPPKMLRVEVGSFL